MKYNISVYILTLLLLSSCSKESLTFITPSDYKYVKTITYSPKVFEIKNGNIIETSQHPFDADLKLIKDSTELVMSVFFDAGLFDNFNFIDDKTLKVSGKDGNIPFEIESSYSLNGTKISCEDLEVFPSFSENFEELNQCAEFCILKGTMSDGRPFYSPGFHFCETKDHKASVQRTITNNATINYEYIAVMYVDIVYKKQ